MMHVGMQVVCSFWRRADPLRPPFPRGAAKRIAVRAAMRRKRFGGYRRGSIETMFLIGSTQRVPSGTVNEAYALSASTQ